MFKSNTTFGTPTKPTGFGAPLTFGAPAANTGPSTSFNFGTSGQQPANSFLGANTFGSPAANSTFGGFGTPATSAPAFGTSFGQPTASTSNLFGSASPAKPIFGNTMTPSLFTTPATSAPLFGAGATTQTPSLFGATSAAPSLFGAATTTTPSLFGTSFGATTTTTPSLFGTSTLSTGFGGFKPLTGTSTGFGGFGTGTTGFGTGMGFNFGSTTGTGGLFGAKPPDVPAHVANETKIQQTLTSFYAINVFGDERDDILKKWNLLQASWGTGKGFYNTQQPPVIYDACNPYYRFKAISYIVIPTMDNADGRVKLVFNKKESDLVSQKAMIVTGLNGVLGNKPNLTVHIGHIKGLSENETEMTVTVSEKGVTGACRKIQATDLAAYFNQAVQKQQLSAAGVISVTACAAPSKAQLEEYLKDPPPGIDEQMWRAAQIDNPMSHRYLPMPIMGFANLKKRMLSEESETVLHQRFLAKVGAEICELKKRHTASLAQIAEQKQKFMQLQHRLLKILVKQECTRKIGMVLQPEEEILKGRLEIMYTHLTMPTQFKGKINEMLSTLKIGTYCQDNNRALTHGNQKCEMYKMDPEAQDELKQFLIMQQNGIAHLIKIVNQDLQDLKIITEGMNQLLPHSS